MFAISPAAAETLRPVLEAPDVEGMRLHLEPGITINGHGPAHTISMVPAGAPGDDEEVVVERGIPVFLGPETAPYVADKVLDVEVIDEQLRFTLTSVK